MGVIRVRVSVYVKVSSVLWVSWCYVYFWFLQVEAVCLPVH